MANILALGCCILCLLFPRSLASSVDVSTSEQFRGALRNQSVSTIVLRHNLSVASEDWQQYSKLEPLVLRRNVTIKSDPLGLSLDFDYVQLKVRIAKGLQLTFQDLIIDQIRCGLSLASRGSAILSAYASFSSRWSYPSHVNSLRVPQA